MGIMQTVQNIVGPALLPLPGQPGYTGYAGTGINAPDVPAPSVSTAAPDSGITSVQPVGSSVIDPRALAAIAGGGGGGAPQAAPAPASPASSYVDQLTQQAAMPQQVAPPPPATHHGILGAIGDFARDFVTGNPYTFAGNIMNHSIWHAAEAARMYPYMLQEAQLKRRGEIADLAEKIGRAQQEEGAGQASLATAGKTRAETGEAQVLSDEAEALAQKGLFKDKDGNLRGTDANGNPFTAYETPTQLTKSNHLLSGLIDSRDAAAAALAAAKKSGDKVKEMIYQAQYNKYDELATNIKDSARAYAASAEGQTAKLITELPQLKQSGINTAVRAGATLGAARINQQTHLLTGGGGGGSGRNMGNGFWKD